MKVALINKVFSYRHGGGERYALDLARGMVESGCEVHLIAGIAEDVPAEARIHLVSMPSRPASRRVLSFSRSVRKILQSQSFDLAYGLTQCYPVDMFFLGGGVHQHWMRIRYPNRMYRCYRYISNPVHLINLHLESQIYRRYLPARVIANSQLCKQHVMDYYGVPDERIQVIHHGVNRQVFHPGVREQFRKQQRKELGVSDEDLVLLFVSHNWARKGLPTILRAVNQLGRDGSRYTILVVGKGKPKSYRSLTEELGLADRIRFLGPSSEIARYYAASDVFALPTLYDPFAVVCLEAMGCGLPAITSAANGASEIIHHSRDGFVMDDARDFHTLSQYLRQLNDDGFRARMGQAASDTAADHTHLNNVAQTIAACREVAREKQR